MIILSSMETSKDFQEAFQNFMNEYSSVFTIVLSISILLSILIFIIHIVNLNKHADNPQMRKTVMNNLMVSGVCLVAEGAISVILAIMYFLFGRY